QIRRQQDRERRTRNLVIAALAVLVIGGGALIYFLVYPPSFAQPKVDVSAVYSVPDEGRKHVPEGTPIPYQHIPPSSGNHYPPPGAPKPWGSYKDAVGPGYFVHSLEHGGVVLLYTCSGN